MNRHFIFTSGRSGSNYISNTLNLCPDCVNYGEVLGEWTLPYKFIGKILCNDAGSEGYLNYIYSSRLFFWVAQFYSAYSHVKSGRKLNFKSISRTSSIGVKDFLVTLERRKGFEFFRNNSDIKIIYLRRENLLKKYVSLLFMGSNRIASTYHEIEIKPVKVDIDKMIKSLDVMLDESIREKEFLASLSHHEVMNIEYETYFESQQSISDWNKKMFKFLNITPVTTQSGQKKILPDLLEKTVTNSSEIFKALSGTQYERFLY